MLSFKTKLLNILIAFFHVNSIFPTLLTPFANSDFTGKISLTFILAQYIL